MLKPFHSHVNCCPSYHIVQFTDVCHGPALSVQAGAGAGAEQTHGGHVALDDLARPRQPDGDALRLYVLCGVLLVYILDPRDLSSSHELHFYMKKKDKNEIYALLKTR